MMDNQDISYEETNSPEKGEGFVSVQKYKDYVTNEIGFRINEESGLAGISRMYLAQVMFEKENHYLERKQFKDYTRTHNSITEKVGFGGYRTLQEIKDNKEIILAHFAYLITYIEQHYKSIEEIYIPSTGATSHEIFDLLVEKGIIREKKQEQIGVTLQLK